MRTRVFAIGVLVAFVFLIPEAGFSQGMGEASAIASQNLRGYTHMFIAYAIAWALVVGWVVSIARRLDRVEKALKD
ncbi:MAG: CcmD family protein [Longimicrobiales bacterium]